MTNAAYLQFNPAQQQLVSCCGLDMGINPPDMGLRRTTSTPVSIPETFLDSSCFTVMRCSVFFFLSIYLYFHIIYFPLILSLLILQQIQAPPTWDADLPNLYNVAFDQGRQPTFPVQPFSGKTELSCVFYLHFIDLINPEG